jgi:subtilisin family serine protease
VGAHVISISLGGVLDSACQEIIDRAIFDENIIVVAAAGQYVDFLSANQSVIEPASYDNVIAVAGSDPTTGPWDGSCRGPAVDISAPAKGIWFPNFFLDGTQGIYHGEGTSFAAAEVAVIAALWLAHWGRDHLRRQYPNVLLAHVFRHLARMTAFNRRNGTRTGAPVSSTPTRFSASGCRRRVRLSRLISRTIPRLSSCQGFWTGGIVSQPGFGTDSSTRAAR